MGIPNIRHFGPEYVTEKKKNLILQIDMNMSSH